jgi:hypothetical protein
VASDLRVLWVGPQTSTTDALPRLGIDVSMVPAGEAGDRPRGLWEARRQLRRSKVDVVHLEGLPAVLAWTLPARLAGLPSVGHVEGDLSGAGAGPRMMPTRVVVESRMAAALLPNPRRARIAPVAVESLVEGSFPTFGPLHTLGVVCPAELREGQHTFLTAFAAAFRRPARARAILMTRAGHDPEKVRRLQSLSSALGVGDRVELVVETIAAHLPRLDVFVHVPADPSREPRAILEAMAAGVPVIGSDHGADAEVIEHDATGLLVAPEDAGDLTLQLMRLDHDRGLRARLAAAGLRRAQDFSPAKAAEVLVEVYREVAGR